MDVTKIFGHFSVRSKSPNTPAGCRFDRGRDLCKCDRTEHSAPTSKGDDDDVRRCKQIVYFEIFVEDNGSFARRFHRQSLKRNSQFARH